MPRFSYHEKSSEIIPSKSLPINASAYQTEFTNKKTERVNFKELDCYRDKFKNIKVSFMPITKKAEKTMNSYSKEAPAINSSIRKMNATERGQESHYIRHLTTESRVNFRGENNKIVSEIKHKNLYGLKYAY